MRAAFFLTTLVLALALGVLAGASESRLFLRALIVGAVPAIWALSHVVERLMGRGMWQDRAPYPYRWMRDPDQAPMPPPNAVRDADERQRQSDARAALRRAA
jgi:hypothetical protein